MDNKILEIGIDVDDTVFKMLYKWIEHIATKTGVPASHWYAHLDGGFKTFWKVVLEQTGYNPLAWWKSGELYCYRKVQMYDHAFATIHKWVDAGHKVTFITTSFDEHMKSKDQAIERELYLCRDRFNIIHTDVKHAYEFDVFIDDAEHNVVPYATTHPDALVLMLRTPVNKSFATTQLGRDVVVDDWMEIEYRVDSFIKGE